jgi:hypothetical protein
LEFGTERFTQRTGQTSKEINDCILEFTSKEILQYVLTKEQLKVCNDEVKIVRPLIQEQLYHVENVLLNDSDTRQAIVHNIDKDETKFPCISLLHFLPVNKTLDLKVFMRSSNVVDMLDIDICFLNAILIEVAKNSGFKPNRVTLFISSAHIYI